jgi:hypothetical protein
MLEFNPEDEGRFPHEEVTESNQVEYKRLIF